MLSLYESIGQRILEALNQQGKDVREFGRDMKYSDLHLKLILKGERNLNVTEIDRIAAYLTISRDELLKPMEEKKYDDNPLRTPIPEAFLEAVTTEEGKAGLEKAFMVIDLINEYEQQSEEAIALRNQPSRFSGFKQVREFKPKK